MLVAELIEMLQEMDEDAQVKFAYQPSWPMEQRVTEAVQVNIKEENIVYLANAFGGNNYLLQEACEELGW